MKQKDLTLIAVAVFVSAVVAIILSHLVFAPPKARQQAVEVVSPISPTFSTPDTKYFNGQSVDPTQLIQIGNTTNPNPFNGQ